MALLDDATALTDPGIPGAEAVGVTELDAAEAELDRALSLRQDLAFYQ